MSFKSLFIIFAIGICAVSCHTDGDNGLTSKVIDGEHPSRYYSPLEPENHGDHVEHDEHLYDNHHDDYDHHHDQEHDVDELYDNGGFQAHDPLNQYAPEIKTHPMEHNKVAPPQVNHLQDVPPPTYEQATGLPATVDGDRVLNEQNNVPANAPHQAMRERLGERVNRLAEASGRRTTNAIHAARPKLETLRVDLKDRAVSLKSDPKVLRGLEAVSRKKASLKGKLLSLKAQHDLRKAERLQHQQNNVNSDPAINGAHPSQNGLPTAGHEDVTYNNNDQTHH